jgi:hypothetical protein
MFLLMCNSISKMNGADTMKYRISLLFFMMVCFFVITPAYAAQSSITEVEGYSCLGVDKSRQQTEQLALEDAKRKAVENALTYIKSETKIKNAMLEKDILEAFANANVTVLERKLSAWYKDERSGDCFKLTINAEVVPDEKALKPLAEKYAETENPSMPLKVRLWTNKNEYALGEKMKIYLKGNKPFYVRLIYKDASGHLVQLLPNPFRRDNYFNGGVIYEVPTGDDRFELEVCPPCGEENLIVYASTAQLGEIDLEESKAMRGVYEVKTKGMDIGTKTRGVGVHPVSIGKTDKLPLAEFFEGEAKVRTKRD